MQYNRFLFIILSCLSTYYTELVLAIDEAYFIDLKAEESIDETLFHTNVLAFLKDNEIEYSAIEFNQVTPLLNNKKKSKIINAIRIKVNKKEKIYSIYNKLQKSAFIKKYKISIPQNVKLNYI